MILNRKQFIEYWDTVCPYVGSSTGSPLWIPENFSTIKITCEYFIQTKIFLNYSDPTEKERYHAWCKETLFGQVRCFSSDTDNQIEWYGFTNREDAVIWTLKWSK